MSRRDLEISIIMQHHYFVPSPCVRNTICSLEHCGSHNQDQGDDGLQGAGARRRSSDHVVNLLPLPPRMRSPAPTRSVRRLFRSCRVLSTFRTPQHTRLDTLLITTFLLAITHIPRNIHPQDEGHQAQLGGACGRYVADVVIVRTSLMIERTGAAMDTSGGRHKS